MSDPGISASQGAGPTTTDSSTTPATTSSRAYRTHPALRSGPASRRRAIERAAHPRWNGDRFKYSRQQERQLADLRTYERAKSCDELPVLARSMDGARLVRLYLDGHARPYDLPPAIARQLDDDFDVVRVKREVLRWLLAVALGFKTEWLVARHADFAELLGTSEITAARALRSLEASQLVARQPQFSPVVVNTDGGGRYRCHVRGPNAYRVTAVTLNLLGISRGEVAWHAAGYSPDQNDRAAEISRDLSASEHGGGDLVRGEARPTAAPVPEGRPPDQVPDADESQLLACDADPSSEPAAPLGREGEEARPAPGASATREVAMFRRRLATQLDALEQRAARAQVAMQRDLFEASREQYRALEDHKRVLREAVTRLVTGAGGSARGAIGAVCELGVDVGGLVLSAEDARAARVLAERLERRQREVNTAELERRLGSLDERVEQLDAGDNQDDDEHGGQP